MIRADEVFYIGKISKYRGVAGEVELSFTDDAFDRGHAEYLVLDIDGILVPFFWESYRFKNDQVAILKFEDIDSEEAAKRIVGLKVYYPYAMLDEDDNELSSVRALTGFTVIDVNFGKIGIISAVDDSSANILLTVEKTDGSEMMIPYHDNFLEDFNLKGRTLTLSLPEGLFELN